jgi:ribose transport system ATP-binding protein
VKGTGEPVRTTGEPPPPLLEAVHVSKSFPAVRALDDVSVACDAGTVVALVGQNGAGKSTLLKILSGVFPPDSGSIRVRGATVSWSSPDAARRAGVSTVFQEFSLLPNLSIAENLYLGRELVRGILRLDRPAMERAAGRILAELGAPLPPGRPVHGLSTAYQQVVEIAKGLVADADTFIFDEPTAALAPAEVRRLFQVIRQLRARGKGILYVSHRLPEVFDLADKVVVLKDGRAVAAMPTREATPAVVIRLMVGREVEDVYPARTGRRGRPVLVVEGLSAPGLAGPIDLALHEGEIVGLAGLEGHGQRELLRALYGLAPLTHGTVTLGGARLTGRSVREAIRRGVALLPPKGDGLIPSLSIMDNVLLGPLVRRPLWQTVPRRSAVVADFMRRLNVRATSERQPVAELSGGTQQKVALARCLAIGVSVLLCEEPTRGVDVGAKVEIYRLLRDLANRGTAVLVFSRELPELLGLCDRLVVMHGGRLRADIPAEGATEEQVMRAALGDVA